MHQRALPTGSFRLRAPPAAPRQLAQKDVAAQISAERGCALQASAGAAPQGS